MAGGGVLPGAVMAAYDSLVQALSEASEDASIGYVKWSQPISACFKVDKDNTQIAQFDAYLHLKEWQAGKEKISILLHAHEAISRVTKKIIKSTVNVDYYAIEGNTSKHRHSLHFDFEGAQACHPLFHAQICDDTIALPAGMADVLSFRYQSNASANGCFGRTRIPTADMTLPSVLLCLAADFLEPKFFTSYLESVRDIQAQMPLPAFEATQQSIADAHVGHLRSSHWFAHM